MKRVAAISGRSSMTASLKRGQGVALAHTRTGKSKAAVETAQGLAAESASQNLMGWLQPRKAEARACATGILARDGRLRKDVGDFGWIAHPAFRAGVIRHCKD